jgi:nicotinic acid mononucleotide adenylyltransferase
VTGLDISSTAIRELMVAGGDPRFLVPESVRVILEQNHCYS